MKTLEPESIKCSPFHPSHLLSGILTWEEERRPKETADCQRLPRQRLKSNEHRLARRAPVCSSSSIEVAGLTLAKVTQILHRSGCLSVRGCRTTETFYRTVTPIGQNCLVCQQTDYTHILRACPGSLVSCSLLAPYFFCGLCSSISSAGGIPTYSCVFSIPPHSALHFTAELTNSRASPPAAHLSWYIKLIEKRVSE